MIQFRLVLQIRDAIINTTNQLRACQSSLIHAFNALHKFGVLEPFMWKIDYKNFSSKIELQIWSFWSIFVIFGRFSNFLNFWRNGALNISLLTSHETSNFIHVTSIFVQKWTIAKNNGKFTNDTSNLTKDHWCWMKQSQSYSSDPLLVTWQ